MVCRSEEVELSRLRKSHPLRTRELPSGRLQAYVRVRRKFITLGSADDAVTDRR